MNKKCYRLVWNRQLGLFQVACEFARATTKSAASPVAFLSGKMSTGVLISLIGVTCMAWMPVATAIEKPVQNGGVIKGGNGKAGDNGNSGANGADAITKWGNIMSSQTPAEAGRHGMDGEAGGDGRNGWYSSSMYPALLNNNEIKGGKGGQGGSGGNGGNGGKRGASVAGGNGGVGGNGGRGGNAMMIWDAGVTLDNNSANSVTGSAKIIGGDGGKGGAGGKGGDGGGIGGRKGEDGNAGRNAMGGYGIYVTADRSHIINGALISPGKNGDGSVSQASIMYGKGARNSRLELRDGSRITSLVDARLSTGANTLALGSADTFSQGTFNVAEIGNAYLGFNAYEKTGPGTWILSGTTTAATPWTIREGGLEIGEEQALGAKDKALTFAATASATDTGKEPYSAQLNVTRSLTMERELVLDGDATVNVTGGQVLTSEGVIRGAGTLNVTGSNSKFLLRSGADRHSGGLTVAGEATLAFEAGARFATSGTYAQSQGSTLQIDLDDSTNAVITADQAHLAGTLKITNYLSGGAASSSQVAAANRTLIKTANGITGDFADRIVDVALEGHDYLRQSIKVVGNDYVIGMALAWDSASAPDGVFTLDGGSFTIDRPLANRADGGGDLTMEGPGQLTLTAQNTYSGLTRINAGIISAGGRDVIRASSGLQVADTGAFHADDFAQTIMQISSTGIRDASLHISDLPEAVAQISSTEPGGVIELGKATLTLAGDASTSGRYTGRISGDGGLVMNGGLTQHLHGDRALDYKGPTVLNDGVLVLHGLSSKSADKEIVINGGWLDVTDNPEVEQWSGVRLSDKSRNRKNKARAGDGGVLMARGKNTLEVFGGGIFGSYLQQAVQKMGANTGLHKSGTGTLTFTEPSDHVGPTRIAAGTVTLAGNGSIAQSSRVELVEPGVMLDISPSQAPVHLNNLSGVPGSMLALGEQDVILHQGEDTVYAGDIAGNGGIAVRGGKSVTLMGNTAYTGDTLLDEGELVLDGGAGGAQLYSNVIALRGSSLRLKRAASLTGSIDPTDLSLEAGSLWNMTDDSQVDTLTLAGTVNFVAPPLPMQSGRTLTASNWVGQGGAVRLYSVFDNGGSVTDQIVIDGGSATGVTNLEVVNAGGLGEKIDGDGIRLVATTNGASTDPEAFQLQNRLVAGAYRYSLKRGGATSPDDWFLVSALRAETSLLGALGNQGLSYGEAVLGNLHERTGPVAQLMLKKEPQVWGRLFGQQNSRADSVGVISGKSDARGFQAGSDVYVQASDSRRDSVGMYLAIGQSDADIRHNNGVDESSIVAGRNIMRGYSVGTYFTQLHHGGTYLDLALQGTRYVSSSRSSETVTSSTTGIGALASVEIGKIFAFGNGHQIEPQVQLALQKIDLSDVDIDEASKVRFGSSVSLSQRLGLKWSKTLSQGSQQLATTWLAMDVLNNSGSNLNTVFSGPEGSSETTIVDSLPGVRTRLSGGIHGAISKSVKVDVRLSAETSIDNANMTSFGGKLGVTWLF
jgi:outer membrane autotransporter protein